MQMVMTIEELQQQIQMLTDKVQRLEKFQEKMEPNMWFVIGAKAVVGVFALAAVSLFCIGLYRFAGLEKDLHYQAEALAKLEKAEDENRQANIHLTQLIIERFPRMHSALVHQGRLVKIAGEDIVIETTEEKLSLKLAPDVRVLIKGKKAKLSDLEQGMLVSVVLDQDKVIAIEVIGGAPLGPRRRS
jgi:hypothetical protein